MPNLRSGKRILMVHVSFWGMLLEEPQMTRTLYEKYLEWAPENCYAWSKYAELERSLSETERARAIFELAIAQPALDMPELHWKVMLQTLFLCEKEITGSHLVADLLLFWQGLLAFISFGE
ncbi:hypothetical protein IFM89_034741 [Coptis chinensis]|uniref:Uncharacterized protein n=1 Tax=Coptis chinensis TaxID=261450 RepID=A0A835LGJ8_9MAGN|nr:hypothetical protein IFM89_034741 [Coptis chinensis]